MNPPSALHGAMSRDRKPFTYTPGGLDLSEIKSSRMAARLMRNAMNEGVPELPKQQIQSPPMPSTPIAVPNFNCLPVQVFPAFNLPANPKSLLRTRSNPGQPRDLPIQRAAPPQPQPSPFVNNNNSRAPGATPYDTFNKSTPTYSQVNNNRPVSMYEYGCPASTYTPTSYGKENYTPVLPEISYDAEYFRAPPKFNADAGSMVGPADIIKPNNVDNIFTPKITNQESIIPFQAPIKYQGYTEDIFKPDIKSTEVAVLIDNSNLYKGYTDMLLKPVIENKDTAPQFFDSNKQQGSFDDKFQIESKEIITPFSETSQSENNLVSDIGSYLQNTMQTYNNFKNNDKSEKILNLEVETKDTLIEELPKSVPNYSTFGSEATLSTKLIEDLADPDSQKKEVKIVKKQVIKQENNVKEQNGSSDQNGDSEVQAVIKLPAKKSAAKTETNVEVTKKTLPDGSIEEVKKTITKTTTDGRTEIKTKTETTIIPKEEDDDEEVEEVEEEEEAQEIENEQEEVIDEPKVTIVKKTSDETVKPKENGQDNIIKTEERSETTTTSSKKLVIVQDESEELKEEEEEEVAEEKATENVEPATFVIKQPAEKSEEKPEPPQQEEEEVEESQEVEEEDEEKYEEIQEQEAVIEIQKKEEIQKDENKISLPIEKDSQEVDEEVEEEEEYEEAEEKVPEPVLVTKEKEIDEKLEQEVEVEEKKDVAEPSEKVFVIETKIDGADDNKQEQIQNVTEEKQEVIVENQEHKSEKKDVSEEIYTPKIEKPEIPEQKVPLREPSVPLEKVEDVEIKPIGLGDYLTKTRTENTEIITNISEKPTGLLTELNRIENIVTVNRTVKTLDQSYENITQQGIPTLKTYFTPHIDKISSSPQPSRPYQPVYPSEPAPERRHSLLLERISVERQLPSDIYQNNYQYNSQTVEQQRQWSQEPQAEVLTVSNVKPSQITNQQWYQQKENAIYNNVGPSPQPAQTAAPSWTQPKPQAQPLYKPQPQFQSSPQPQYHQTSPQPQYHQPSPQPQYHQASPQPQYQAAPPPQTQYQPSYTENVQENTSSTYQNTYSTYAPKPTNWVSHQKPLSPIPTIITPSQPNQYSYKDSSDSYQQFTQNYSSSSSYVPPPWEQDSSYVAPEAPQNFYQPPPQTSSFSPAPNQGWKPNLPTSKFNKPPPTAYIPPKPNQSFVVPVTNTEPPRMPGRKTYYSEYERRYISVPESTYIPGEGKYQAQPDPSPAYYYDNNEPAETVEPQWRRELREFTEKSQSQTTTETNVKPPWEAELKYAKAPELTYTPTPTWSQTVRPQSWRERSFESEFVSQEWPKTNTLGRGRPLSSYGKETVPVRTRGVSVDRYNPNSYQSPVIAEHPPVQTHTHVPPAPHATGYHNPNVPAYHARASAEPREQVSYQQPRAREVQASPFQSRSFKYLQWITGTED